VRWVTRFEAKRMLTPDEFGWLSHALVERPAGSYLRVPREEVGASDGTAAEAHSLGRPSASSDSNANRHASGRVFGTGFPRPSHDTAHRTGYRPTGTRHPRPARKRQNSHAPRTRPPFIPSEVRSEHASRPGAHDTGASPPTASGQILVRRGQHGGTRRFSSAATGDRVTDLIGIRQICASHPQGTEASMTAPSPAVM
jgi:hypothetical protein